MVRRHADESLQKEGKPTKVKDPTNSQALVVEGGTMDFLPVMKCCSESNHFFFKILRVGVAFTETS